MIQLPLIVPPCEWKAPTLSELPSDWNRARRVAIDTETFDPYLMTLGPSVRRGGYIVGVSFALEDGPKHYLPIRHQVGDDNLPPQQVLSYIRDQAKSFSGDVVGTNLGYDLDFLAEENIDFPQKRFYRDIQVAEPLLDEFRNSYSLDNLALSYLGEGKQRKMLYEAAAAYGRRVKKGARDDIGSWIWRVPGRYVGQYAEADVTQPLRIIERQERKLDEQELWNIYDLESKLLPVLVKMRRRGVRVDMDHLDANERWSIEQERLCYVEIKRLTGIQLEVGESMQAEPLAKALNAVGIRTNTTMAGNASIDKEFLEGLKHPVADLIRRARKMGQLRTTFVNSVREHQINGRIHCTFNQLRRTKEDGENTGAAFGRLSCQDLNLQQQPARDEEIGPRWRKVYVPEPGEEWMSADYSQQEPRMAIHYSILSGEANPPLISHSAYQAACEAAQRFWDDPSTDNHQMLADMAGIDRKQAKEIYLGLSYGMGGAKLCYKLGLPTRALIWDRGANRAIPLATDRGQELLQQGGNTWEGAGEEGQALLDRFDAKVPFIRQTAKAASKRAEKRGFIITIEGRRCRFPDLGNGKFDWTHKAFNRIIQGGSADQTKKAMVEIDAAGLPLNVQVHDEIGASIATRQQAKQIVEIMENCVPLRVPSKVDLEIGPSWGEAA